MEKIILVVGAAIIHDEKILAVQRGESKALPGLWEFPGGKIEAGETPELALVREIREELGADITVLDSVARAKHRYPFGIVDLEIFIAHFKGEPIFQLSEHVDCRWLTAEALAKVNWAPADLPAASRLQELLN